MEPLTTVTLTAQDALAADCYAVTVAMPLIDVPPAITGTIYAVFNTTESLKTAEGFLGLILDVESATSRPQTFGEFAVFRPSTVLTPDTPLREALGVLDPMHQPAVPVFDNQGVFLGVVTHKSVTNLLLERERMLAKDLDQERKRRQKADEVANQLQEDFQDFLEHATEGLHWVGPDGTILWANQTELDLLGYSHEEYIGHHIAEFHVDRPVVEDILQHLLNHETLYNYEARLRCKNGSIRYVLINSNVFWRNGEFIHTRCFTRDISHRKLIEEEHRRLAAIVESS